MTAMPTLVTLALQLGSAASGAPQGRLQLPPPSVIVKDFDQPLVPGNKYPVTIELKNTSKTQVGAMVMNCGVEHSFAEDSPHLAIVHDKTCFRNHPTPVRLAPGESKTIDIGLRVEVGAAPGDYTFKMTLLEAPNLLAGEKVDRKVAFSDPIKFRIAKP